MKIFYNAVTLLLAIALPVALYGQLTPPYSEDFEANDGGWTSTGISNTWQWGIPAGSYIQTAAPCDGGQNAWVTNLTGVYNDDELSYLTSPEFDFSALTQDPILAFQHIYITESCCDEGWVELSTNGGGAWTKVGTFGSGQNWYNDSSDEVWNGSSGAGSGNWQTASNTLTGTAGLSSVMIRFVFQSDGSVVEDGFGVDNISITETFDNAGVIALNSPVSQCGLTATETVEIEIINSGSSTINSIDLCYTINGGAPVCETVSVTLLPGASHIHAFAATADFSGAGSYDLTVYSSLTGDAYECDDAMNAVIESQPLISAFPYSEDFESGTGGWIAYGTNNTWQLGSPNGSYVSGSGGCGSTAWATNLNGNYSNDEFSYVESPCLDFSSLASDPVLVFSHIYATESCCDQGWVEYSTDGGLNWNILGTMGTGMNWYNDADDVWNDFSASGSGNWQTAANMLTGLAGEANVKLRMVFSSDGSVVDDGFGFDNIMITETYENASPSALLTPVSGCGLSSAEIIEVGITNSGLSAINSIDVCYQVNSGTPVCETAAITINPGATTVYAFSGTADFSVSGAYEVTVYTNFAGDVFGCDDTTVFTLESQQTIASFPYNEDFESGNGGWLSYGDNNSWELGAPSGDYVTSTASCGGGNNAWATSLSSEYNDDELSFVESPCFDFSSLTGDPVITFDHIFSSEDGWDYGWMEYSTDGGTTWNVLGTMGSGQNWYNDFSDYWTGDSDAGAGNWQLASHVLTGLAGESSVKLRMAFSSDGGSNYDGFGFDNIMVAETFDNAYPTALITPVTGCGLSSAEIVEIEITNSGSTTINAIDVCYVLNSGTPVCETAAITINPGATGSYAFTVPVDLSVAGSYDIQVITNLAGDAFPCDDTAMYTILSQEIIASFPYTEDFESGSAGWSAYGTNNSWALGTPAGSYISSTDPCYGGNNAWVTNLAGVYNDDEFSFVESPCFDLSAFATDPVLVFSHAYSTESCCDHGWVEFSTDGGNSWNTLGTSGTGQNWYNDLNDYWNDESAAGSGNWQTAYNNLTGLAGESAVKLRFVFQSDGSVNEDGFGFDNIMIVPSVVDVQADSVGYTVACSYSNAETITGHFFNNGPATLTSLDVCYTINGGAPVCETISGSILPGVAHSYDFMTTADLSSAGNYDVVIYVNDPTGIDLCDDSTMATIVYPVAVDLTDSVLCTGMNLVINSNVADATYDWSTGESTASITVNTAGEYSVEVTDNTTGCVSADTIDVIEVDLVLAAVTTNELSGNDGTIDLTVTGGNSPYAFDWDNGASTEDLSGLSAGTYEVIVTDANGCMDSTMASLISEVGIAENALKGFEVYPNPFRNELTITPVSALNQVVYGELRDASGRVVTLFTIASNSPETLDLSGIERGVYFLSLQVNGEVMITKVIKQ